MSKWICFDPVVYGRRNYSPDAKDERDRVINLPVGIQPDETIKKHFRLEGTLAPEPKHATAIKPPEPMPDIHQKIELEGKKK